MTHLVSASLDPRLRGRRPWRKRLVAPAVVALSVLLGCGERQEQEPEVLETFGVEAGAAMDTTPAGTPAPPQEAAIEAAAAERVIDAVLDEWSIRLSQAELGAGPTTIRIRNSGRVPHEFEIEGPGVDEEVQAIPPGGTASLTVDLQPGTYEIVCDMTTDGVDHVEAGMRARLVVR